MHLAIPCIPTPLGHVISPCITKPEKARSELTKPEKARSEMTRSEMTREDHK